MTAREAATWARALVVLTRSCATGGVHGVLAHQVHVAAGGSPHGLFKVFWQGLDQPRSIRAPVAYLLCAKRVLAVPKTFDPAALGRLITNTPFGTGRLRSWTDAASATLGLVPIGRMTDTARMSRPGRLQRGTR